MQINVRETRMDTYTPEWTIQRHFILKHESNIVF